MQNNPPDTQQLTRLVTAIAMDRDKTAFRELFLAVSPRLMAYAQRCGATRNEAEEVVQECLLAVWHKAHTYHPQTAAVNTWLYTIVRNKRVDILRKQRKAPIRAEDLWPPSEGKLPDRQTDSDLEGRVVRTLIESLPETQRQIVHRVYFRGQTHTEIADDLEIPVGTVKSRLRLAMKKLETLADEHLTWLIIIHLMTS
jgi:RNA polymerase sigma-70 factor (ECF subfamily)